MIQFWSVVFFKRSFAENFPVFPILELLLLKRCLVILLKTRRRYLANIHLFKVSNRNIRKMTSLNKYLRKACNKMSKSPSLCSGWFQHTYYTPWVDFPQITLKNIRLTKNLYVMYIQGRRHEIKSMGLKLPKNRPPTMVGRHG